MRESAQLAIKVEIVRLVVTRGTSKAVQVTENKKMKRMFCISKVGNTEDKDQQSIPTKDQTRQSKTSKDKDHQINPTKDLTRQSNSFKDKDLQDNPTKDKVQTTIREKVL